MRTRWWWALAIAALWLLAPAGRTAVRAQTVDELKQRIQELERSTREQVEALKRLIQQQEAERQQERRTQEDRERVLRALQEQVEQQQLSLQKQTERVARFMDGWEHFFDLQAGRKQGADAERAPLGKEIQGNVYTGDTFKIRLGGSLRLHVQRNDTPVGESVSRALLPDPSTPGGGNEGGRDNFRAFAGRTRFNLTLDGPTVLGGRTGGFLELDFNRLLQNGESGSPINPNVRLRHAFGRWVFDNVMLPGDEVTLVLGQTTSFADNVPDTVDFNTMLAGLGAALRRNPRLELVHRIPFGSPDVKFLYALGVERPVFDSQFLTGGDIPSNDLGAGALSGFPALSGGIGLETGRLGIIGRSGLWLRTTWGQFEERFAAGTTTADFNREVGFREERFTNQTAWGTFDLDRIGFNRKGRAGTLRLKGGFLWTRGEARLLNAEFDRRVIVDDDGSPTPAQSLGGFINPMFWLTDTLSIRAAFGEQWALDADRPVASGSLISNFFRVNNRQLEVGVWWTPGPWTFGIAYNHTVTDFRRVFPAGGSESRENENNKVEFISWFSF